VGVGRGVGVSNWPKGGTGVGEKTTNGVSVKVGLGGGVAIGETAPGVVGVGVGPMVPGPGVITTIR
jgi:hypothetical protein